MKIISILFCCFCDCFWFLLNAWQAFRTLHDADVLFRQGGAFLSDATGLVTQKAVNALQNLKVVRYFIGFGQSRKEQAASVPLPPSDQLFGPAERKAAQDIFEVFKSFFDVNFPSYEIVNCYSCFDLEVPLSWSQRKDLLTALAGHEGLAPEVCW
jgi:hypothetical protein